MKNKTKLYVAKTCLNCENSCKIQTISESAIVTCPKYKPKEKEIKKEKK